MNTLYKIRIIDFETVAIKVERKEELVSPPRLKDCGEALSRLEELTGADWTQRLDTWWSKSNIVSTFP